ncbi:hypothetical protein ACLB2K_066529 [Fragaria x ananassa]
MAVFQFGSAAPNPQVGSLVHVEALAWGSLQASSTSRFRLLSSSNLIPCSCCRSERQVDHDILQLCFSFSRSYSCDKQKTLPDFLKKMPDNKLCFITWKSGCLAVLQNRDCKDLEELPEAMGKLTNLRHLRVKRSRKLKLTRSIAKLTSLQTLDQVNIFSDGFMFWGSWCHLKYCKFAIYMSKVKKVGFEYSRIIESSSSSSSFEVTLFPNLKKFVFVYLPEWEKWEGMAAGVSEDSLAKTEEAWSGPRSVTSQTSKLTVRLYKKTESESNNKKKIESSCYPNSSAASFSQQLKINYQSHGRGNYWNWEFSFMFNHAQYERLVCSSC